MGFAIFTYPQFFRVKWDQGYQSKITPPLWLTHFSPETTLSSDTWIFRALWKPTKHSFRFVFRMRSPHLVQAPFWLTWMFHLKPNISSDAWISQVVLKGTKTHIKLLCFQNGKSESSPGSRRRKARGFELRQSAQERPQEISFDRFTCWRKRVTHGWVELTSIYYLDIRGTKINLVFVH